MARKTLLLLVSIALLSQGSFAFIYGLRDCPDLNKGRYHLNVSQSGGELTIGGSYQNSGVSWALRGSWPGDAFTEDGAPLKRLVQNEIKTASDRLYAFQSSRHDVHCFYATTSNYGVELHRSK